MGVTSPIILDLDGQGVQTLSASSSHARYDMDGDGLADDTSWFGSTEGILVLDRNGDGKVTNAGEFSFIGDVAGARTDLEGLHAWDSNHDGILSNLDVRFNDFRVWQDKDGDGVQEDGELLTLTTAGVKSINLTGTAATGTSNPGDVVIANTGTYTRTNGSTMSFIDASLTYFSAQDHLPEVAEQAQSFASKSNHYAISFAGGDMFVGLKKAARSLDPRAGQLSLVSSMTFPGKMVGVFSPIILDLDGDGIEMRKMSKAHTYFDVDGDGERDRVGWASGGDGFLVIDRNGDGKITDGSELTFAPENSDARNALEALAALDNNNDHKIDASDARFGELKVWVDANRNGTTDDGELKTLTELGIESIGLSPHNLEGSMKVGSNALLSTAVFTRTDGTTGSVGDTALSFQKGPSGFAEALQTIAGERLVDQSLDAENLVARMRSAMSGDSDAVQANGASHNWQYGPAIPVDDAALAQGDGSASLDPGLHQRLLALMAQEMAAFGAPGGEGTFGRNDQDPPRFDFFA
jgi:hypothetical protein